MNFPGHRRIGNGIDRPPSRLANVSLDFGAMHPLYIVYLNGPDIASLALDDAEILDAVESGLEAQGRNAAVLEQGVCLVPENSALGHFNVLAGVVRPMRLAGVKVVGDFAANQAIGLPPEIGVLTLFDPDTGEPVAILNATPICGMRGGALTAIGAKHLARKDSKILAHIGAPGAAHWNIRLLNHLFDFAEI